MKYRHARLRIFSPSPLPLSEFLPNADGLVAPGMQCTYTVTFTPDSLANYVEELRVSGVIH